MEFPVLAHPGNWENHRGLGRRPGDKTMERPWKRELRESVGAKFPMGKLRSNNYDSVGRLGCMGFWGR